MKGKFITFEGCEGVGKSRQVKLLAEYLDGKGIKYIVTREPGGSSVSEQIRAVILDQNNKNMTDSCEALLYAAARAQLLEEKIKPLLDDGYLVICDRYVDSSFAYQGFARGLGLDFVKSINSFALENFNPDLTLFLDLPPEQAFKRKGGIDKNDRLELAGLEFHNKVYEGYKAVAEIYKDRIFTIDASGTKQETHQKIINALKNKGII